MILRAFRVAAVSILAFTASAAAVQSSDLSFADRVKAQEAIERVYYSHQTGADKTFETAVSRDLLERKVARYLKQSAALEKYWHTPVTAEMLERELLRMTHGTRTPDRLRELFAALDNDPLLIRECLARAILVDRLTRNFFAFDPRFHMSARREADELYEALTSGALDPWQKQPRRTEAELSRESHDGGLDDEPRLDRWLTRLPGAVGEVLPVVEAREAFQVQVLLEASEVNLRLATYRIEKTSWDSWWRSVSPGLDENVVVTVTPKGLSVSLEIGSADRGWDPQSWRRLGDDDPCEDYDTWDTGALDDLPDSTWGHTAIWTGSVMLTWGKSDHGLWRYDPATDTWMGASTVDAPQRTTNHTAVWTGDLMLVWGGTGELNETDTGGRYDPTTDTWTTITTTGAPSPRRNQTAVWDGSRMLVWGGVDDVSGNVVYFGDGGRYDPDSDTWSAIALEDAPSARTDHTAVWTGSLMLVWGGTGELGETNTGGRYDPATDTWTAITTTDAGLGRTLHTAVWTGSVMLVWGGWSSDSSYANPGRGYDPVTDSWTTLSQSSAPAGRIRHTAVWTGEQMLVWGGSFSAGGQYDPAGDTWTTIATVGEPSHRTDHSAAWTGSHMVIWGGRSAGDVQFTGGRYDPVARSWTAVATSHAPSRRYDHTAVWTGNLMLIWGGSQGWDDQLDTGSRYDPATDAWTVISTTDAPRERASHTAVWTGDVMVVWGGYKQYTDEYTPDAWSSGGRYEPISDTWSATSYAEAPGARFEHTAVWTGELMLIWGGYDGYDYLESTGGRYDPDTDSWTATSTSDAPAPRYAHTAVWTGDVMVVWGGQNYTDLWLDDGGRYDPATDSWEATSLTGAPTPRLEHTAVWTGNAMVIWGGRGGSGGTQVGGRYDPVADAWMASSIVDAPPTYALTTAVWTGTRMVVWGGPEGTEVNTGGRYDPANDTWVPTSTVGAPPARVRHTAVWTGRLMLIWGGRGGSSTSGGRYSLGDSLDDDEDGYTVCEGDCDDGDPATYPGVPETNDGVDNQCPGYEGHGLIDELEGECGFHNPNDSAEFSWPAQPGAAMYEVARFDEPGSPVNCTLTATAGTYLSDLEEPTPGRVFHYLVRAFAPFMGIWGTDSAGIERSDVCP